MNLFWRLVLSFALFVWFFAEVRAVYLYAVNGDLIALTWASSAAIIGFVLLSLLPRKPLILDDEDTEYCISCGYWLRENESGICPECGMPVESEYNES
ncbi:MAG: hypothetical protein DHS20C16_02310 [Phycisphaerae bacterium]|nr:MAG: hypothetical protein DHS20C16_02310 [Phycisphaerae bacterium]